MGIQIDGRYVSSAHRLDWQVRTLKCGSSGSMSDDTACVPVSNDLSSGASSPVESKAEAVINANAIYLMIKPQMKAVMAAHVKYSQEKVAVIRANEALDVVNKANSGEASSPESSSDSDIDDFLGRSASRHRKLDLGWNAFRQEGRKLYPSQQALTSALYELSVTLKRLQEFDQFKDDDLIGAAKHMLGKFDNWQLANDDKPRQGEISLTAEQTAFLQSKKAALRKAQAVAMSARLHRENYEAAQNAFSPFYWGSAPKLTDPARPSEEEVQRFLRQAEEHMARRLKAVRALDNCVQAHQGHLGQIEEAESVLTSSRGEYYDKLGACTESRVWENVTNNICSTVRNVRWELKHIVDEREHDYKLSDRIKPTASEKASIARLRALMRELALALARRTEVEAALQKAHDTERSSRRLSSGQATDAKSWDELRQWWQTKLIEHKQARREYRVFEAKTDLMRSAILYHTEAMEAAASKLRQYVIRCLPLRGTMPCEALHIVMNAAAWMHKAYSQRNKSPKRTGDCPLFSPLDT